MDIPFEPLSESSVCLSQHVTYEDRVDDPNHYNFCLVPGSGADAVLYMSIAVLVGCVVSGKLSSVWILVAGAVMEAFAYHFNLRQLSNASAMWMGMNPPDIFLYIFLPPLLLDSAARIEFFMFRKVAVQSVAFAVFAVVGMAAIMTPLMLYAFDLQAMGWHWSHAALFTCMIASTDAVAVTAVLKKANGPETLAVLMEGESLFNDATSIVLFELMLEKVKGYERGDSDDQAIVGELARTMRSMALLASGGALCGLLAGSITTRLMKLLRVRGMPPEFEVGITFGMGYLVFYLANAPLHLSGVIAVVVYGLYGSATLKWEMSAVASREHFRRFWDVLSQLTNTVVFFFSGAACYNFFIRSLVALESDGHSKAVAITFWRLPIIFVFVMIVRLLLIMLFAPALGVFGYSMDWRGVVLCTVGGMRGSLCLIMVQTVVLDMGNPGSVRDPDKMNAVKSALVMWTAGVVLCTLLINAPALPFVLRVTGLTKVSLLTLQSRDKARQQFLKFTNDCITGMQQNADERMQGVDWHQVKQLVDCTPELKELVAPGDTADLFADAADSQDAGFDPDDISESGHGNEPGLRYPSISHPLVTQDGKSFQKLSSAYSSHGPGATTSFFTRSTVVLPVPRTELQDSFPQNPAPSMTTDALKSAVTLQSAPTLPTAESVDDPLLQASRSGAPRVVQDSPFGASRKNTLEDPTRASVQLDGLPIHKVATMDEAARKRLLNQLDGKMKESMGEGASFVLQKKAAPEPAGNDTASTVAEESVTVPLLSDGEGTSGQRGNDRESAFVTENRRQPLILVMDPLQGFVLTSTSRDDYSNQQSRGSYSHSGRPADARAYLRTSSSRHSVTPFNSKLRGESSLMSGPLSEDLALHQLAALPAGALQRLHEEMVAEHRMRMIAGMKRYFHRKRNEGLLSNQGLRTLDHACDSCMDRPERPIDIFGHLQAEFSPGAFMFLVSTMHFRLRKLHMCMLCIWPWFLRALVSWPVQLLSRMLSTTLSNRLLLALEVAIEYWLALAFSIESKTLNGESNDGPQEAHVQQVLQAEMEEQRGEVWQFINDRHMEAPDRFRAIQTYRAAMAIIAQQRQLIVRMYNTAVLTENEQEIMEEAVDSRERALWERGAAWEPPSTSESLRNLPFFADLPDALFQEIILEGRMIKYHDGAIIEPSSGSGKASADSAFVGVILSGLATTTVEPSTPGFGFGGSGIPVEESSVYLTHGTIFGLSSVLAFEAMPGHGDIVASSKSQATHVFEIPKQVFEMMETRAGNGCVECRNFMLTLYRLFAIQIIERLHELFIASVGNTLCALGHATVVPPGVSDSLTSIPGSVESTPPRGKGGRWRGRHSISGSPAGGGSTVPRSEVQCMWIAVRSLLQQAQLRVLEPGAHELLHSSAVLLRGSLVAATDAAAKRPKRLPCTATAPCALVWAPSKESPGEGALEVFAGSEGAIFVVCDAAQELALRRHLQKAEASQNEL